MIDFLQTFIIFFLHIFLFNQLKLTKKQRYFFVIKINFEKENKKCVNNNLFVLWKKFVFC